MRLALVAVFGLVGCPAPKGSIDNANIVIVTKPIETPPKPVVAPALEPPQPTLHLPTNFVPTGYRARLDLDPAKTVFSGSIAIAGTVSERSSVIWLNGHHLKVARAAATQGDPFDAARASDPQLAVEVVGDELLKLTADRPLEPGAWTLMLDYTGEIDLVSTEGIFKQVSGGASYIFSDFEATYARRVFPCVDEPSAKVPWQLTIDAPKSLVVVSNTKIAKESPLGADRKRVAFDPTKPLPTYLIAFGVGPFEIVDAGKTRTDVPIRVVALKGRAADAAWAVKSTPKIVELLEDYFGTPYPYEKLDLMAIPITANFSAMENAGLITFAETALLVEHPSRTQQHDWVSIAAHELSHQWFGDLVTLAWWDDLWLNEGFADWMENKVSSKFDASWHDELSALDTRDRALDADALVTARAVRQSIATFDDIEGAFDSITYRKGASIIDMFESSLGPEVFQRGIRAYLAAHAFGNATATDFAAAMSTAAGKELGPTFSTFLDQPGTAEIALSCSAGKLSIAQQRFVPPGSATPADGKPWILPVCLAYEKSGKRVETCVTSETATTTVDLKTCPRWIDANVGAHGYYRIAYTSPQLTALRDEAWPLLTWAERLDTFFDLREGARLGKLPLQLALSFVPRVLVGNDRFTVDAAIGLPIGLSKLVPDELRGKYEAWMRATFGAGATQVGFVGKDSDDIDLEGTRRALIGAVAWSGRDPKLVEEAVGLAAKWRDLPHSIRSLVVQIAADAKQDEFDRFVKLVHGEPDHETREELIYALASARDPKRYEQALALISDKSLDIRDTVWMLLAVTTDAQRAVAQQFYLAHEAEIAARMPSDGTGGPVPLLSGLFTGTCQAAKREEMVALVTQHFAKLAMGDRIVKQNIEAMDQCIARRAQLEPEIRGWLTGVKIVKPVVPPPAKPAKPSKKKK